ncbi:MAG: permease DsdX [Verrucomicrobia bacterium]|nr:permease DsdX [Verrucomicrobiota bacterium]
MPTPDLLRVVAALIAIVLLIVLITRFRIHPFVALIIASICLGLLGGVKPDEVMKNFEKGFGDVLSFVGIVIGLGTMLGGLLVTSGGADRLANALVSLGGNRWVPWTIFFAALLIGLPLFFEVGFVLLAPLAFAVARRVNLPIVIVGLPMLAGLSVAHGLVPPHPAPTLAAATFHADLGKTIFFGLVVGLPVGLLSGPAFALVAGRFLRSRIGGPLQERVEGSEKNAVAKNPPTLSAVLIAILLPPVLMMGRSVIDALTAPEFPLRPIADFIGDPVMALLIALLYALVALGLKQGRSLANLEGLLGRSLEPIAAVVLIVGAGGGFKQMLLAVKIDVLISRLATEAHVSPLFLAWLVAALVRVATGSATVATITGAGITAPLLASGSHVSPALMVLATGAGSLILSHVNDAGFWLVKEYFGLSLVETLASWTTMETLLSIFGLLGVLALGTVVHG